MVLNSRELLAGREVTITQRITLKIDIFGFPFFFFNSGIPLSLIAFFE